MTDDERYYQDAKRDALIEVTLNNLHEMMIAMMDVADADGNGIKGFWHNGDEFLFEREEDCESVANFLRALNFPDVHTDYYDPEEDERNNEVDELTGWYYCDFGY